MEAQSPTADMQTQLYEGLMGGICAVIGKSGICYIGKLKDEDGAVLHFSGVEIAPKEYVQVPYDTVIIGPESDIRVRLRNFYGNEVGIKSIPEILIRKEDIESIFGLPVIVRSGTGILPIDLGSAIRRLGRYLERKGWIERV